MTRKLLKLVEVSFYQLHTQLLVELCGKYYSISAGVRIVEVYRLGTKPKQIVGGDSFMTPFSPKEEEVLLIGMLEGLDSSELDLIRAACHVLSLRAKLLSTQTKAAVLTVLQDFLGVEEYEVTTDV